jgi:hypothetical protein
LPRPQDCCPDHRSNPPLSPFSKGGEKGDLLVTLHEPRITMKGI